MELYFAVHASLFPVVEIVLCAVAVRTDDKFSYKAGCIATKWDVV